MVDRVDALGLGGFLLPNSELEAVKLTEKLLQELIEKNDREIIEAKSIHNKAEYNLSALIKKRGELRSVNYIIRCIYAANSNDIFTTKDIHRLSGIPIRTIQYQVQSMVTQGLLLEIERFRYKAVSNK